jgi:hypothetical protein
LSGRIAAAMMTLVGKRILTQHLQKTLAILEQQPVGAAASEPV